MKKVRVEYKNPVDRKTGTMYMKARTIKNYRKHKSSSPYKRITVLRKWMVLGFNFSKRKGV